MECGVYVASSQKIGKDMVCGIVGIVGRQDVAPLLIDGCGGSNTAAT
jgi:hypothetical protein